MSVFDDPDLTQRFERLEIENRRLARNLCNLRRGVAAGALTLAAALALGANARSGSNTTGDLIVLTDPQTGRARVSIGTNPNTGEAGLNVHDRHGNLCIELTVDADGRSSGIRMHDAQRRKRVDIGFDSNGNLVNQLNP